MNSRCRNGFFFQAEDGIRDHCVTGVQTCALPISRQPNLTAALRPCLFRACIRCGSWLLAGVTTGPTDSASDDHLPAVLSALPKPAGEIGRASCRERV